MELSYSTQSRQRSTAWQLRGRSSNVDFFFFEEDELLYRLRQRKRERSREGHSRPISGPPVASGSFRSADTGIDA